MRHLGPRALCPEGSQPTQRDTRRKKQRNWKERRLALRPLVGERGGTIAGSCEKERSRGAAGNTARPGLQPCRAALRGAGGPRTPPAIKATGETGHPVRSVGRSQGHVQVGGGPRAGRAKVWDSLSLKGKPPQNGLWRENESREGTSAGHTRPTGLCRTRTCSPGFRTPRRSDCPPPSIPDTAPSARRLRSQGAVSRGHRASSRPHVREVHPPPRPTALWVPAATNAEPASTPRHWRPLSTTRASSSPSRHPARLSAAEGSPERGVGVQPLPRGAPGSRPAALGPCIPGGVRWRLRPAAGLLAQS